MKGVAIVLSWALAAQAGPSDVIFENGFEVSASSCATGAPLSDAIGPAPATPFASLGCIELRNGSAAPRRETAWGSIPISRDTLFDTDLDRLALVDVSGQRLSAQFEPLSRWAAPLQDSAASIRWLKLATTGEVAANSMTLYELRLYDEPIAAAGSLDATPVSISGTGPTWTIDTGVASFGIDQDNPALLTSITINAMGGPVTALLASARSGPFMQLADGRTLDATSPGLVSIDSSTFRILGEGPARVSIAVDGHFDSGDSASLCVVPGGPSYQRFGWTAVMTFSRASADIDFEWIFRNECSSGGGEPWTDEAVTVNNAGWRWPLAGTTSTPYLIADSTWRMATAPQVVVEQRKGADLGSGWLRRARVLEGASETETAETFDAPALAIDTPDYYALLQMPWMRFREPQALEMSDRELTMQVISEPLVVGEGKGIWALARLSLGPSNTGNPLTPITSAHAAAGLSLEQALTPRRLRNDFNDSQVLPPMGGDGSNLATGYSNFMEAMHQGTLGPGGANQWQRFKTYGSQLWPDVQFDDQWATGTAATPADNSGSMNYWNPSGAEILEFLRLGEPKWLWDFALPQSWLQLQAARLNIGRQTHSNRSGVAVVSGGTGEGHWHRVAGGSDDYTYNVGMHLAYAMQPRVTVRDRFEIGGQAMAARYSIDHNPADPCYTDPGGPQCPDPGDSIWVQSDRDLYISAVTPDRGRLQHFELLANCAEFAPGTAGQLCHDRLQLIMQELASDNLRAGLICQDDVPVDDYCDVPQTFMIAAMQYHFFLRYYLNYGDVNDGNGQPALGSMLSAFMQNYFAQGVVMDGGALDPFGDWAALFGCPLANGGTVIGVCDWYDTGDGIGVIWENKPHIAGMGLMADWVNPSANLCSDGVALIDALFAGVGAGTDDYGPIGGYVAGGGWFKGAAQVAQMLPYAIGAYDRCIAR
ncbi:MAG: hypothetical protein DHS20C11_27240 [Lysobacteraceae bacterium]|nr:MAG: hypothetical protein DHS20C11_27240 [Xanthomonadaceae bacterium]